MGECVVECVVECVTECMVECVVKCVFECMVGCMIECVVECMVKCVIKCMIECVVNCRFQFEKVAVMNRSQQAPELLSKKSDIVNNRDKNDDHDNDSIGDVSGHQGVSPMRWELKTNTCWVPTFTLDA